MTIAITADQQVTLTAQFKDANNLDVLEEHTGVGLHAAPPPHVPQPMWTEDSKGTIVRLELADSTAPGKGMVRETVLTRQVRADNDPIYPSDPAEPTTRPFRDSEGRPTALPHEPSHGPVNEPVVAREPVLQRGNLAVDGLTCVVVGVAPGTANITVTDRGTGKSASTTVVVAPGGIHSVAIISAQPTRRSVKSVQAAGHDTRTTAQARADASAAGRAARSNWSNDPDNPNYQSEADAAAREREVQSIIDNPPRNT